MIISLKKTDGFYKCKDTIVSLEQLMIDTAKDLIKIQTYLNRGRDVEYWQTIKLQKQDLIKKLQLSKKSIEVHIKTFESTLIKKSVQYFIIKITPYKISLQKSLVKINLLSGVATPELNAYAKLLTAQVATIEALNTAETTQELANILAQYVYLKKEIA